MYLCESIVTDEGEYPMCGVLPYRITARKADRKLSLGYRQFELDGKVYRGHEFHYTQFFSEKSGRSTLGRLQGKKPSVWTKPLYQPHRSMMPKASLWRHPFSDIRMY